MRLRILPRFSALALAAYGIVSVVPVARAAFFFNVDSYTASSITFTLSNSLPPPTSEFDNAFGGTSQIDLLYTGSLTNNWNSGSANSLSDEAFTVDSELVAGKTGNFGTSSNYSWMVFSQSLVGLTGSSNPVTLSWSNPSLNTEGTGVISLYWGNLYYGPDPSNTDNQLLSTTQVVNGVVGSTISAVPLPPAVGLLGVAVASLLGFSGLRRKRRA